MLLTGCVTPGKIYSGTVFFSKKCLTCQNRDNEDLGICFTGHWVKYAERDSSEILSIVVPRPIQYNYNESWLITKNHKNYYIIPLYDDSLEIYSFRNFKKFKKAFSDYLIPDSLMIK